MEDKAGTITTKVSDSNNYYVTDIQPINALKGGVSPCITAHYSNAGGHDFMPKQKNGHIPHIAVLEIMKQQCVQVAQMYDIQQKPMNGRVYDVNGVAPTLRTPTGGLSEPKITGYTRDKYGIVENYHAKAVAGVMHTSSGSGGNTDQYVLEKRYRIRKLTEREVFRLMDVDDADIDKILDAKIEVRGKEKRAISKSACYRLAGNSICVGVMFHIFRTLFIDNQPENEYKPKQLELF